MIRVSEPSPDSFIVEASLERPPSIYLDHDSFDELVRRDPLRDRFLNAFRSKGTLLFSWTHVLDLSSAQGRTADLLRSFLESIGPFWIPLEMNPFQMLRKEHGIGAENSSPCVSETLLRAYYPYIHGGPLTLAKIIDLNATDRDAVQHELARLKTEITAMIERWRAEYVADPARLDRMFPRLPFDAAKPGTFVFRELGRIATREGAIARLATE